MIEFTNLVEAFSSYKNDDNLKELVLNIYNFTMSGPFPEDWLHNSAEAFKVDTLDELNQTKWVKVLAKSIKIEVEGYIKMMGKAIEIIKETDGLEPYLDNFTSELSCIKNIYELHFASASGFFKNYTNEKHHKGSRRASSFATCSIYSIKKFTGSV